MVEDAGVTKHCWSTWRNSGGSGGGEGSANATYPGGAGNTPPTTPPQGQ